jgi:hypothetical protein
VTATVAARKNTEELCNLGECLISAGWAIEGSCILNWLQEASMSMWDNIDALPELYVTQARKCILEAVLCGEHEVLKVRSIINNELAILFAIAHTRRTN